VQGVASGDPQGVELEGKGLVFGRDAGVADLLRTRSYARTFLRDPALYFSASCAAGIDRSKRFHFERLDSAVGLAQCSETSPAGRCPYYE